LYKILYSKFSSQQSLAAGEYNAYSYDWSRYGWPPVFRNLAKKATAEQHEVIVLAEEPRPAYDSVQLSAFFSGKTAEDLSRYPTRLF
jgi:hypothetical protein